LISFSLWRMELLTGDSTVYDIITPTGANYFSFMALIGLWVLNTEPYE
jgi:hypothetical protein